MTVSIYEFTVHVERKLRCAATSLDDAQEYVNANAAEPGESLSFLPSLADIEDLPIGWETWHDRVTDAAIAECQSYPD